MDMESNSYGRRSPLVLLEINISTSIYLDRFKKFLLIYFFCDTQSKNAMKYKTGVPKLNTAK